MEDALRKLLAYLVGQPTQKYTLHLPKGNTSADKALAHRPVSRPHISLKARMLGGRAETIMRLGGYLR